MKKIILLILAILLLVLLWFGCSNIKKKDDLSLGTYVFEKSKDDLFKSILRLEENKKSTLVFTVLSSYLCFGTYEINGNELIIKTDDNMYIYCFSIVDNTLVFDGEKSSDKLWGSNIVDGSIFKLEHKTSK